MSKNYTGINIQFPISQLILTGEKSVETRTYPLPAHYIGKEMLFIETPGRSGDFKARIVAIIKFSESFKYESLKDFRKDFNAHKISSKSLWDWTAEKPKYGWVIEYVKPLSPIVLKRRKGIVYTKDIVI